jgi:hypothetical protein
MAAEKNEHNCVDCVAFPESVHLKHGACQTFYDHVERCMKEHRGMVGDCVPEWRQFRACHDKRRDDEAKNRAKSTPSTEQSKLNYEPRVAGLRDVQNGTPRGWFGWR